MQTQYNCKHRCTYCSTYCKHRCTTANTVQNEGAHLHFVLCLKKIRDQKFIQLILLIFLKAFSFLQREGQFVIQIRYLLTILLANAQALRRLCLLVCDFTAFHSCSRAPAHRVRWSMTSRTRWRHPRRAWWLAAAAWRHLRRVWWLAAAAVEASPPSCPSTSWHRPGECICICIYWALQTQAGAHLWLQSAIITAEWLEPGWKGGGGRQVLLSSLIDPKIQNIKKKRNTCYSATSLQRCTKFRVDSSIFYPKMECFCLHNHPSWWRHFLKCDFWNF